MHKAPGKKGEMQHPPPRQAAAYSCCHLQLPAIGHKSFMERPTRQDKSRKRQAGRGQPRGAWPGSGRKVSLSLMTKH